MEIIDKINNFLNQISESNDLLNKHKDLVDKMDFWYTKKSGKDYSKYSDMAEKMKEMEKQMSQEDYERAQFNKLSKMIEQNVQLTRKAEQEYKKLKKKFK